MFATVIGIGTGKTRHIDSEHARKIYSNHANSSTLWNAPQLNQIKQWAYSWDDDQNDLYAPD